MNLNDSYFSINLSKNKKSLIFFFFIKIIKLLFVIKLEFIEKIFFYNIVKIKKKIIF